MIGSGFRYEVVPWVEGRPIVRSLVVDRTQPLGGAGHVIIETGTRNALAIAHELNRPG